MRIASIFAIFIASLSLFACKSKNNSVANAEQKKLADSLSKLGTYWSINQFLDDQLATYGDQPFTLIKIDKNEGSVDTSFFPFADINWKDILTPFRATDISDKKFLGRYKFSMFEDDITANQTMFYEAKEPELYTKTIQITYDPTNKKILSVYIEAASNETLKDESVKLLYMPLKIIQIQNYKSKIIGKGHGTVTEYRYE